MAAEEDTFIPDRPGGEGIGEGVLKGLGSAGRLMVPGVNIAEVLRQIQDPTTPDRLRSALHGFTLQHGGQVAAGAGALKDTLLGQGSKSGLGEMLRTLTEEYSKRAPEAVAKYHEAAEQYPAQNIAGGMAVPIPGPGKLAALGKAAPVARAGLGGLIGAGIGAATGDTDVPWWQRAAAGFVPGLVGGGLAEGLGAIAGKGGRMAAEAAAEEAQTAFGKGGKELARAAGGKGGKTTGILTHYNQMKEILARPGEYSGATVANARRNLEDPRYRRLVQEAASNAAARGPEELSGGYQSAENVLQGARSAAEATTSPEAIAARQAKKFSPGAVLREQIWPRLKTYAERSVPTIAGAYLGGTGGAAAGALMSLALGKPGTAAANALKSPAVRNAIGRTAELVGSKAAPVAAAIGSRAPSMLGPALRGDEDTFTPEDTFVPDAPVTQRQQGPRVRKYSGASP